MSPQSLPDGSAPLYRIKADLFKSLGHPTRIQILEVLSAAPEHAASVRDLLEKLAVEPSQLSQHLAVLKNARVVSSARTGNAVVYRLSQPQVADLLVVARAFLRNSLSSATEQLTAADALPSISPWVPNPDPQPGGNTPTPKDAPAVRNENAGDGAVTPSRETSA